MKERCGRHVTGEFSIGLKVGSIENVVLLEIKENECDEAILMQHYIFVVIACSQQSPPFICS